MSLIRLLNKYRNEGLFKIFRCDGVFPECDGDYIKHAFFVPYSCAFPFSEITLRRFDNLFLLLYVYIFLWRSLNAVTSGLDLHKMYSILVAGDDVYLQVSAAPVSLQYHVSTFFEKPAGYVFSFLSYCASEIISTLHAPSSFLTTATFSFFIPIVASML